MHVTFFTRNAEFMGLRIIVFEGKYFRSIYFTSSISDILYHDSGKIESRIFDEQPVLPSRLYEGICHQEPIWGGGVIKREACTMRTYTFHIFFQLALC